MALISLTQTAFARNFYRFSLFITETISSFSKSCISFSPNITI